jgi:hypothetical protein
MFERGLNVFWIMLGAAIAAQSWQIGISGPSGPESGLFPLIAGMIMAITGLVLLLKTSTRARAVEWPHGAGIVRVAGVVIGIGVMAVGVDYLGFVLASTVTMLVLLRTIERSSWIGSIALTVGSVAAVVWIFGHLLGMPLPRGPWGW